MNEVSFDDTKHFVCLLNFFLVCAPENLVLSRISQNNRQAEEAATHTSSELGELSENVLIRAVVVFSALETFCLMGCMFTGTLLTYLLTFLHSRYFRHFPVSLGSKISRVSVFSGEKS